MQRRGLHKPTFFSRLPQTITTSILSISLRVLLLPCVIRKPHFPTPFRPSHPPVGQLDGGSAGYKSTRTSRSSR
ncbi:hypothetical protein E2C01_081915 [Portunus trituberculatus]|uniref:Uncharacterized protein n=1 Tax=Portunus trituberculatus TaxID=210409 RepID=A0A5B7IZE1_PORTR|nr:hypothetical protein [Portunus trituberculatus]